MRTTRTTLLVLGAMTSGVSAIGNMGDLGEAPAPDRLTRFSGVRSENGEIIGVTLSDKKMPSRDSAPEVIGLLELGTDDHGRTLWTVQIQKVNFPDAVKMAQTAIDYAQTQGCKDFITGARDLIGPANDTFVGTEWSTILVRRAADQETFQACDLGHVSFSKGESRKGLVVLNANRDLLRIFEIDLESLSAWLSASWDGDPMANYSRRVNEIEAQNVPELVDTKATFLRRAPQGMVLISDGETNIAFACKDGNLERIDDFTGRMELGLEPGNVNVFEGDPDDSDDVMRVELVPTESLIGPARTVFEIAAA